MLCFIALNCDAWSCRCSCMGSMSVVMQMVCVLCASCGSSQCCICMTCSLLMLVENARGDHMEYAPKDSLPVVELSQWYGKPCAKCVYPSLPQQWGPDYRFLDSRPCGPAGWLAMLLIKPGDVETNPGPATTQTSLDL